MLILTKKNFNFLKKKIFFHHSKKKILLIPVFVDLQLNKVSLFLKICF